MTIWIWKYLLRTNQIITAIYTGRFSFKKKSFLESFKLFSLFSELLEFTWADECTNTLRLPSFCNKCSESFMILDNLPKKQSKKK